MRQEAYSDMTDEALLDLAYMTTKECENLRLHSMTPWAAMNELRRRGSAKRHSPPLTNV